MRYECLIDVITQDCYLHEVPFNSGNEWFRTTSRRCISLVVPGFVLVIVISAVMMQAGSGFPATPQSHIVTQAQVAMELLAHKWEGYCHTNPSYDCLKFTLANIGSTGLEIITVRIGDLTYKGEGLSASTSLASGWTLCEASCDS